MIQDYLIGELSARLERLQAASAGTAGAFTRARLARLRRQVETRPASELRAETIRALALADRLCRGSLSKGDTAAFDHQAAIAADLRLFGISARLLDEK
jgi:hypothetical protein